VNYPFKDIREQLSDKNRKGGPEIASLKSNATKQTKQDHAFVSCHIWSKLFHACPIATD